MRRCAFLLALLVAFRLPLPAEAGMAAFKIAYDRWAADPTRRDLARLVRESLHDLKTLTAGETPRQRAK